MSIIFKFCPIQPNGPAFEGLPQWSTQRRLGHTASRLALALAYQELCLTRAQSPFEQLHHALDFKNEEWLKDHCHDLLKEEEHHRLALGPEFLISRSHTKTLAVGALCLETFGPLSLGIDLEPSDREIKPELTRYFVHPADQVHDPLTAWCAKEASFKAISSALRIKQNHESLTLSQIQLKSTSEDEAEFVLTLPQGQARGMVDWREIDFPKACPHLFAKARLLDLTL
jgi:hypothetical protein